MFSLGRRFGLLVGIAAALAFSAPVGAQETVDLRFSTDSPPTNIKVEAQMKWSELAKERSDGRLNIRIFPNAQLYNDINAIPAVSSGSVDMAAPPSILLSSVVPASAVFELPSMWGLSYDEYRTLLASDFGKSLEKQYEEKLGVKVIGYYNIGSWIWASNAGPIATLDDFEGQKLRIVGNPVVEESMKAFGAVPVQVSWPEVPTALVQGVIDGLETSLSGYTSVKGWELTKYLTFSDHKDLPYVFIINKESWNDIPADLQKIMLETFEESRAWHDSELVKRNEPMLQTFRDNGTTVNILDEAELATMIDAASDVEKEYVEGAGLSEDAALAREAVGRR